jgi:hypothetical protein
MCMLRILEWSLGRREKRGKGLGFETDDIVSGKGRGYLGCLNIGF